MGFRNFTRDRKAGASISSQLQNFVGITDAPKPLEQTKAEI